LWCNYGKLTGQFGRLSGPQIRLNILDHAQKPIPRILCAKDCRVSTFKTPGVSNLELQC